VNHAGAPALRDSRQAPNTLTDQFPPVLVSDGEMLRKVEQSTVSLVSLVEGQVRAEQIERAFSSEGCGAVLIELDGPRSAMYEQFYRLQWQLGTRAFESDVEEKTAAAKFAALDLPVRQLLCRCGVGVVRNRTGLTNPVPRSPVDVSKLLRNNAAPLTGAVGRPMATNRQEFHPSVEWLLEKEQAGCLRNDGNPSYQIVSPAGGHAGAPIMGRSQADEARLLALYREWEAASPEEQRGHGNKYNGDVYYGAFRGRVHLDFGITMTVLFGPGDVRDRDGFPVPGTTKSRELGGTLMVASPGEEALTSLPYRLPGGSPYVVVFFERYYEPRLTPPAPTGEASAINTSALGWAATVHGVCRIEDPAFSRGQAVVHVLPHLCWSAV
jgi:hypothetical protein